MAVRELDTRTQYVSDGYTNERSLGKLMLDQPDVLVPTLTRLWGTDSNKFTITSMTEGQVGGLKEVNSVLYRWKTQGRARHSESIVKFDAANDPNPGLGGKPFFVYFKSGLLIEQYGLIAPDGVTKARIMAKPEKQSDGSFKYALQLKNPNVACNLSNLTPGKFWVMTAPTVPESFSRGNRSNIRGIGEMFNQISFQRYSKHIGGNLANKVVEIEFEMEDGSKSNLWINEEMRQFEIDMRMYNDEHHWTSEFNRQADGSIHMIDWDSEEPIPEGAGIFEMIKEVNYDTYGEVLTLQKIKGTINHVFDKDTDTGKMEIVLVCGSGFADDFHEAIMNDAKANGFTQALGEKMISGTQGMLSYGNTFTQYRDIKGNTITVKIDNIFDFGLLAENDRNNGNLHPRTGRPMSSHVGVFIDNSIYEGERNMTMAVQKGQGDIFGILKGLSPIPASWGVLPVTGQSVNLLGTTIDEASYERKFSKGINIRNTTSCFMLQSVK
ncbi:MAG: hypothetical protein WC346_03870 [Methanogenium sp.]|jgi:hypothetical protein